MSLLLIICAALIHSESRTIPGQRNSGFGIDTVGIFEGRTPCHPDLAAINGIDTGGCFRVKFRLVLMQGPNTESPGTFQISSIYVGKGDLVYQNSGTWSILTGTAANPKAQIFRLALENSQGVILLQKGDENVLFFLDGKKNLLVGDESLSYTLNRVSKKISK